MIVRSSSKVFSWSLECYEVHAGPTCGNKTPILKKPRYWASEKDIQNQRSLATKSLVYVLSPALLQFGKSLMSVTFLPAVLGLEMAAPILCAPGIFWHFLLANIHAHKILFLWARGFFWTMLRHFSRGRLRAAQGTVAPEVSWEFPNLVVSNLVFAIFTQKRSFALFSLAPCTALFCTHLHVSAYDRV